QSVHGFSPGTYDLGTPVAVSTGGLAEPRDSVTFTAGNDSKGKFRGNASTGGPPGPIHPTGPGKVELKGAIQVLHPDRSVTTVDSITLDSGPYDVMLTPAANGFTISGTLQGPTH